MEAISAPRGEGIEATSAFRLRRRRVVFVWPDTESINGGCKRVIHSLVSSGQWEVYTIGAPDGFLPEVLRSGANHLPIPMARYISPLSDVSYLFALYRAFRQLTPDIIVNFTPKPNIYGTLAARLSGCETVICGVCGLGSPFVSGGGIIAAAIRIIVTLLYFFAFRLASRIWFKNPNDLAYFVKMGVAPSGKVMLTTECVDTEYFSIDQVDGETVAALKRELRINDRSVVVTMVCRMLWSKGVKEFVEAAEMLAKKYPEAMFLLVGPLASGNFGAVPEAYLLSHCSSQQLRWLGHRREVREIYAVSALTVLPSYYREGGFPHALLEPMSMARPVIAGDTPDCRGPVEDGVNGFVIPVRDAQALAGAIEKLITDEQKRIAFGRRSREKARMEFDESRFVEEVTNELNALVAGADGS